MEKSKTARVKTSMTTHYELMVSNKLYMQRARLTLPYIVRQAKAGQTIYYSDLAQLVDMPNPRNLNYVLGAIGSALIDLGKRTKVEIPPIQCLVISKSNDLPGDGIEFFISTNDFRKLTKSQKQKVITAQLTKIFTFQLWDWVLEQFGLEPIKTNIQPLLISAKNTRGGGEGIKHKEFKEYISKNPQIIGLAPDLKNGQMEYPLPSADTIDVLFSDNKLKIGVEVKSIISDSADILRGLFQCIKYKSLLEAEQIVNDELPNSRVILVLQGQLPIELLIIKNLLGIEVIDNISLK